MPLFSLRSARELGHRRDRRSGAVRAWLRRAGSPLPAVAAYRVRCRPASSSPYSALSAMAIDPVYVSMPDVQDFRALGGEVRLPLVDQIALRTARAAGRVEYGAVRQAKESALRLSFSLFYDVDWLRGTARAGSFAAFASWEDWWLDDYALFCALRAASRRTLVADWPEPVRSRQPAALEAARDELQREIRFYQYLQWLADAQWADAREALGEVRLFGDLPFMVGADSADVWANQHLFRFDRTVGHAARRLQRDGQDWGLPVYAGTAMARDDSALAAPARTAHEPALRRLPRRSRHRLLPHLLARRSARSVGRFTPAGEDDQRQAGRADPAALQETGVRSHRRRPRPRPGLRPRVAATTAACPATRCCAGSATGTRPGTPVPRPPRTTRAVGRDDRHARHRDRWPSGGTSRARREARDVLRCLDLAAVASSRTAVRRRRSATRCCALPIEPARTSLLLPMQDVFGWRDRINVPAHRRRRQLDVAAAARGREPMARPMPHALAACADSLRDAGRLPNATASGSCRRWTRSRARAERRRRVAQHAGAAVARGAARQGRAARLLDLRLHQLHAHAAGPEEARAQYPDELVVIGVHSPQVRATRRRSTTCGSIIGRYDIDHPVAQDAEFRIWRAYTVRAWPTLRARSIRPATSSRRCPARATARSSIR